MEHHSIHLYQLNN